MNQAKEKLAKYYPENEVRVDVKNHKVYINSYNFLEHTLIDKCKVVEDVLMHECGFADYEYLNDLVGDDFSYYVIQVHN